MEEKVPIEKIIAREFGYKDDLAQELWEWKDKYKGERVFVIGNGRSLLKTPLEDLIGEHCFATNKIADIYDKTEWRPTLYQLMTGHTSHWRDSILETIELGIPSFIWWRRAELVGYHPNIIWTEIYHEHEPRWEYDVSKGLGKSTSGVIMIQLAMYMGFNPIVLVGFDSNWRPTSAGVDPNHFADDYLPNVSDEEARRWNKVAPKAHALAQEAADEIGVEIVDATIDGSLTAHRKVSWESLG